MSAISNSESKMHIGKNIKKIRELNGIKQDALARDINMSQQDISDIEKRKTVDDATLALIAQALNVSTDTIKHFDSEALLRNVTNNFNDNAVVHLQNQNPSFYDQAMQENHITSIEKITELYERLLQESRETLDRERARNANLEALVTKLRSE